MLARRFLALTCTAALALFCPGCAGLPTVRLRTVTLTTGVIQGVEKSEATSVAESVGLGFEVNPAPR